jgi:hypothetical protein
LLEAEAKEREMRAVPHAKTARNTIYSQFNCLARAKSTMRACLSKLFEAVREAEQSGEADRLVYVELTLANRALKEAGAHGDVLMQKYAPQVAGIVACIFEERPRVESYFRALLERTCPYVRPGFATPAAGPPGLRENDTLERYTDRMKANFRLWFAILVLREDLAAVWRWLAAATNTSEPDLVLTELSFVALQVAGRAAHRRYGPQFRKLVECVGGLGTSTYLAALEARGPKPEERSLLIGASIRLEEWCRSFLETGNAPEPENFDIPEETESSQINL